MRCSSAGIAQLDDAEVICSEFIKVHFRGEGFRISAHDHPQEAEVVDSDVKKGTAAQFGLKLALAAGAFGDEAVVTARVAEFAVLTGPDYFQKLFVERQEADPEGFHDKEPLFLRDPVEVCGISRAGGKRLLAEHVFAGVKA